jgi:hypothetical protein
MNLPTIWLTTSALLYFALLKLAAWPWWGIVLLPFADVLGPIMAVSLLFAVVLLAICL